MGCVQVLAGWLVVLLLVGSARCSQEDVATVVVGISDCTDCSQHNIPPAMAFTGLEVSMVCKNEKGELTPRAKGKMDHKGHFVIQLPNGLLNEKGQLKQECFALIQNGTNNMPCPIQEGLQATRLVYKSLENGKPTYIFRGKLAFSYLFCNSATLSLICSHPWFIYHPLCISPLPRFDFSPLIPFPRIPFPTTTGFPDSGNPFPIPTTGFPQTPGLGSPVPTYGLSPTPPTSLTPLPMAPPLPVVESPPAFLSPTRSTPGVPLSPLLVHSSVPVPRSPPLVHGTLPTPPSPLLVHGSTPAPPSPLPVHSMTPAKPNPSLVHGSVPAPPSPLLVYGSTPAPPSHGSIRTPPSPLPVHGSVPVPRSPLLVHGSLLAPPFVNPTPPPVQRGGLARTAPLAPTTPTSPLPKPPHEGSSPPSPLPPPVRRGGFARTGTSPPTKPTPPLPKPPTPTLPLPKPPHTGFPTTTAHKKKKLTKPGIPAV